MPQDSLSRRQWLTGSLACAAAIAVPGRGRATTGLPDGVAPPALPAIAPPPPPAPPVPVDTARLLSVARRELERNAKSIWLRDRVGIVDFSLPSRHPRLFIVDLLSGTVKPHFVTHGRGSDPEHDGWLKLFSDMPGSLASSRGAYACGAYYQGKHGLSMRLAGLDRDNANALDRAIVIHGATYADPALINATGKLGRSEGCFAVPEVKLMDVIAAIGGGRLLFADKL